jgi:hypothetical protein
MQSPLDEVGYDVHEVKGDVDAVRRNIVNDRRRPKIASIPRYGCLVASH